LLSVSSSLTQAAAAGELVVRPSEAEAQRMEIVPHVGIGTVRLGMSCEEADWRRDPGALRDSGSQAPDDPVRHSAEYAEYDGAEVHKI
jgi:hypothetical protein